MGGPAWNQIVLQDPDCLSGASVRAFVEPIFRSLRIKDVVVADLVGAAQGLSRKQFTVLPLDEFMTRVADADQYDWAFFFCSIDGKRSKIVNDAEDYRPDIDQSDLVVRLVDSNYFYVYGRDDLLFSGLRHKYPFAEFKQVYSVYELDIPY